MDAIETKEQPVNAARGDKPVASVRDTVMPSQQAGQAPCPSCGVPGASGSATASYVYALGRIEPRFPTLGVEKAYAQALGPTETKGLTNQQALHKVLSKRENRYLVRQMCWILTIEGIETYILRPHPGEFDLLVDALRSDPCPMDIDVIIGRRGPIAPPELCNGLMVPIVAVERTYSFDRDTFIGSIPKPEKVGAKEFAAAAAELLDRIMQMADNAGATDEHRALNYLVVSYPAIYAKAAEEYAANASLMAVEVRPSLLSGTRHIEEVVFSYVHRQTDVIEKFFVRVDVTEGNPYLVTKLSPYYDH